MQCYNELLPPTAVTHAVSLPFLAPDATNVVVAKTSLLQVFDVARAPGDGGEKLLLVGEYPLSGTVTAMVRVKTIETKTGGEALLLAFKDAKLSLLDWDPENHRTSTISIHFYEGENVTTQPFGPCLDECESILTVDPGSRCAALKFGARQLAILPFRQSGDELVGEEVDGFDIEHTSPAILRRESTQQDASGELEQTLYKASFVLPLTALDPSLSLTVHLAFLHEYREPTFGILSAQIQPSTALLDERKDILAYTVFTLDLEQRASTNLITVQKLPSTLWKVVPLPLPIGGALLIGANEFVHIDQSGKANATAVNEFARLESDFGMTDQSDLNLELEGCAIEILDAKSGELLVVLRDGSLATVNFQMMGRSISSVNIARVSSENGADSVIAAPSCATKVGNSKLFVGSELGASTLLGWSRPTINVISRKRSHAQMLGKGMDEEDEDVVEEDDDDLYDAEPESKKRAVSSADMLADTSPTFEVQDVLHSIGPINDVCLGRASGSGKDKLQMVAGTGKGRSSRLTCMNRDIVPQLIRQSTFENATSAWAIHAKQDALSNGNSNRENLLFVFDGKHVRPYDLVESENGYTERSAPEFETEGDTLEIQTLANGSIVVQCRRSEIRTYDANLALNQIIPMVDDETDAEFNIVHASFCDPYLLVVRNDSSVQVLKVQGKEIELLEGEGSAVEGKMWLSGCVYSGSLTGGNPALFLLSADGNAQAFTLPDLHSVFATSALPHLPPVFSVETTQRKVGTKDVLTELLVADLGQDGMTQPYLIVRTAMDDVILYEPFNFPQPTSSDPWHRGLRFRKVPVPYIPKYSEPLSTDDTARPEALKTIRVGEYDAVTIPGSPPCLLLKETSFLPKILELRQLHESDRAYGISPINRVGCEYGFFTIDDRGSLQECQLPPDTWYGVGWSVHQIDFGGGREVRQVAYLESKGMYVVATCVKVDFYFAEEDGRHPDQDDISLRPQVPQYSIHLVSSKTHRILNSHDMPYLETVTALKVMLLEVSENTHKQELRIVVASAAQRGEDMPAKGAVTVFDVLNVVPEPDVPESDYKLHVIAREDARGAITALTVFPGGFIGTAQGQKILIRGLKEDGSCLPVAFLDAQCHTNTMKTLEGRGMWLAGDAWKGLWFGGFTEEPYKLTVLGKSPDTRMEVMAADFLPFDGSLYLLIIDAAMDLHVLQYDPENPKTVNGLRLLHRSTFHVGHFPTSMTLLPSALAPSAQQDPFINGDGTPPHQSPTSLFHILITSLTGSIGLITPLDESAYRRLSALQTHLTSILEHAAGLNPRAYRAIESESFGGGARGVVDGSLVGRISELGAARRVDVLGRAGADAWGLRSDLEVVGGSGLGYL